MNRRQFLFSVAAGAISAAYAPRTFAVDSTGSTSLRISPNEIVAKVPVDFMGLSYEANQLAHPELFNASNTSLVKFFRDLGTGGVLRIGGNSSEFTVWNPTPAADLSDIALPYNPGKTHRRTPVTPDSIDNLAGFLDVVGWKLIYGLNLGMGTPEQAAEEAAYVTKSIGRRLMCLQIGNEPDLFHRNGLRSKDWAFDDYFAQWTQFADAVRAKTPGAPMAGPDVAGNIDWIKQMSEKAKDRIGLLSGHYYAEGPPTNPAMTIDRLLRNSSKLDRDIGDIDDICRVSGLPYRMTETNSCYNGGKAGVSDTFASALWAADYALRLASVGYAGVNFHGGGNGLYTPIAGDPTAGYSARPLYYGLRLASGFAGIELVRADLDTAGASISAYAAKIRTGLQIALFNKDPEQPASIAIDAGMPIRDGSISRLTAPSVDSKDGVSFEKAGVIQTRLASCNVDLPPASASLIFLTFA